VGHRATLLDGGGGSVELVVDPPRGAGRPEQVPA